MNPGELFLRIRVAGSEDRIHPIGEGAIRLGRSPECDVVIDQPWISRRHLELRALPDGGLHLRDLDSRNPPRFGGIERREARLEPGDTFVIGEAEVSLGRGDPDADAFRPHSTAVIFDTEPAPGAVTTEIPLAEPASGSGSSSSSSSSGSVARAGDPAAERFRRLAELGERIGAAGRTSELLRTALDGIFEILPVTRGFVGLGTPLEGEFAEIAVRDPASPDGTRLGMSRTILETIFRNRSALLVRDAPRLGGIHDSIDALGIRSFAAAPLIVRDREAGVIYVDSSGREPLGDGDLEALKLVARLCALALENLSARERLEEQNQALRGILERRPGLIGSSKPMLEILSLIDRAAALESPVLLLGETGTGKEVVARAIHDRSPRREKPFVAFHCALSSPSMIDAELFGHVRGAFTEAVRDHKGVFEQAEGGTLLLDEIGDMPLESQVKILRALQERTIVPVGGEKPIRVDVRIISATHRDLEARQRAGLFREDLRYRLDVIRILLPPLRDRGDDILEIAESLLPEGRSLTDGARRALLGHAWPGNVRELRNAIEQSLFRAQGAAIQRRDLPPAIASAGSRARIETPLGTLEEIERRHIARVLEATGGNKKQAAEILGIARETLYQKLKGYEGGGGTP